MGDIVQFIRIIFQVVKLIHIVLVFDQFVCFRADQSETTNLADRFCAVIIRLASQDGSQ